jgi:hypothetical protein
MLESLQNVLKNKDSVVVISASIIVCLIGVFIGNNLNDDDKSDNDVSEIIKNEATGYGSSNDNISEEIEKNDMSIESPIDINAETANDSNITSDSSITDNAITDSSITDTSNNDTSITDSSITDSSNNDITSDTITSNITTNDSSTGKGLIDENKSIPDNTNNNIYSEPINDNVSSVLSENIEKPPQNNIEIPLSNNIETIPSEPSTTSSVEKPIILEEYGGKSRSKKNRKHKKSKKSRKHRK